MHHDYTCPECSHRLHDQFRTAAQGGRTTCPACPQCKTQMDWVVPRLRTDLRTDGEGKSGERFQKFTARDGRNQLVEIDSLHTLRRIERESETLARNGEGQQIRFRAFEQGHSNMAVNTFGDGPQEKPDDYAKEKFGLRGAAKSVEAPGDGSDPSYEYGPGVSDANTSALQVD